MQFLSLDSVVKKVLLDKGYPIHYYLKCLSYAVDIAQTLSVDDIAVINTSIITLDNFGAAKLPDDYVDYTKIGMLAGQMIKPLVPHDGLSRIANEDSTGNQTSWFDNVNNVPFSYLPNLFYTQAVFNGYGEYIGREFGKGAGVEKDIYKIIKERGIIQCHESMKGQKIILEYISSGCCVIGSIGIEFYARETVRDYILWKLKENSRGSNGFEIQQAEGNYINQRKILRARLNDLDPNMMRRILQRSYHAAPKN